MAFTDHGFHHALLCSDPRPKDLKFSRALMIPKKGTVYDHIYIQKQYGSWNTWSSLITQVSIDAKAQVSWLVGSLRGCCGYTCLPEYIYLTRSSAVVKVSLSLEAERFFFSEVYDALPSAPVLHRFSVLLMTSV